MIFKAVSISIAALICSLIILAGLYPYHPKSLIGWVTLYIVSFPTVVLFDTLNEKIFSKEISSRLGGTGRIIYGIVIVGTLILMSILIVSWLDAYLVKWDV